MVISEVGTEIAHRDVLEEVYNMVYSMPKMLQSVQE